MKRRKAFPLLLVLLLLLFSSPVKGDILTVSGTFDYTSAHTMLDLVNQQRAANGLHALEYDYNLEYYATQRAAEISVLNSHLHPNGTATPYYENYSIGWSSAEEAVSTFMNSQSHRQNILNSGFTGMAAAVFSDGAQWYWVQVFSQGTDPGVANGASGWISDSRSVDTGTSQVDASAYDDHLQLEVGNYIMASGGSNGQILSAMWSSDDPNVATVGADGKITGVASGTAVITANFSGTIKRILVTVVGGGAPVAPPVTEPPATAPPITEPPATEPIETVPTVAQIEYPTEEITTPVTEETTNAIPQENITSAPLSPQTDTTTESPAVVIGAVTSSSEYKSETSSSANETERSTGTSKVSKSSMKATDPSVRSSDKEKAKQPLTAMMTVTQTDQEAVNLPLLFLAGTAFLGTSAVLGYSIVKDIKRAKKRRETFRPFSETKLR